MPETHDHDGERLAPVTFLPGVATSSAPVQRAAGLPPRDARRMPSFSFDDDGDGDDGDEAYDGDDRGDADAADSNVGSGAPRAKEGTSAVPAAELSQEQQIAAAVDLVARKLRSRGLSEQEVRSALATAGVTKIVAEDAVAVLTDRGWLSDALLAEQLVHGAVTRKGMGRRAIQQLLVKRGIARDVVENVIAELPDDDGDRALDLARDKARTLVRYDDATAMRRLLGVLARRGFGGSQATAAARTAMAEARGEASGASNVVRFR